MRKLMLAASLSVCLAATSICAFAASSPELDGDVTCTQTDSEGNTYVFELDEDGNFSYDDEDGHHWVIKYETLSSEDEDVLAVADGDLSVITSNFSGSDLADEGWEVYEKVDANLYMDDVLTHSDDVFNLSIPSDLFSADDTYTVIHKMNDGNWEICDSTADDGYVYATVNGLSPIFVLKQTDSNNEEDSEATGSMNTAVAAACVSVAAIVCGAGLVITSKRTKKA